MIVPIRILAISGSLRQASSNTAALQAAAMLAPAGMEIILYDGLGALPHFNPDLDTDVPPLPVQALREKIGTCEDLLVSSPEYARGMAGAMKNALDWLVGSQEFPEKPVAVINASPRSHHADAQLRAVLMTMSARLVGDVSTALPLLGRKLDAQAIVADPDLANALRSTLRDFIEAIGSRQARIA